MDYKKWLDDTLRRYGGADLDLLGDVLRPLLIPVTSLDPMIRKRPGTNYYSADFAVSLDARWNEVLVPGCTGKFVSQDFLSGKAWGEIAKGRILQIDDQGGLALGEVYTGFGNKMQPLQDALGRLELGDLLEVDQYGASAKVLSSIVEAALSRRATVSGFEVRRMPEDCAKHVGAYYYYDFEFSRDGETRRVEVKSLWGTDTRYARLIHSKTKGYLTSSCKFETQDIFAVSLFLRTGNVNDFAFAASCSSADCRHGLPPAKKYPDYVNQNPLCEVGGGVWYASIDEVWALCDSCYDSASG